MPVNAVAENVFGTIGTICWSGQVLPQIYHTHRLKSTEGLSSWLMLLWATSGPYIGVYNIAKHFNIPLILQPQLFTFLAAISWAQCLYFGHRWSLPKVLLMFTSYCTLFALFQWAMVVVVGPPTDRGHEAPVNTFVALNITLIVAGFIVQFWEMFKAGAVQGLSLTFILIDVSGAVFSLLSLLFRPTVDVLASFNYSLIFVLDSLIAAVAIVLSKRAKRQADRAAMQHVEMDPDANNLPVQD